jgi:hypothetical protein
MQAMEEEQMNGSFEYILVRNYFSYDAVAPPPPLGCSIDLDDTQIIFDPGKQQIRINLSGQQVDRLKTWPWPGVRDQG